MVGFIIRRVLSAVLVLIIVSMVVFALFWLGPAQPGATHLRRAAPVLPGEARCDRAVDGARPDRGQPPTASGPRASFVGREITFSPAEVYDCSAPCLGISYATRIPVTDELSKKYPATLSLAIGGAAIYLIVGVFIGVLAARYRSTAADKLLVTVDAGGLGHPLLRDRPAGLDLPDPEVAGLPQRPATPRSPTTHGCGSPGSYYPGSCWASTAPRPTRGSPAVRWWRRSARTTSERPWPRGRRATWSSSSTRCGPRSSR